MPLPSHVTEAADLVTPHSEIRAGFIKMALEKNERAGPHIAAARALRARAIHLGSPAAIVSDPIIKDALLSAAGLSNKALQYLDDDDKQQAIIEFSKKYLEPSGLEFADELTYRFMLTRGDALGGEMRNVAGRLGDIRLLEFILGALAIRSIAARWRHRDTKQWSDVTDSGEAARYGIGLEWMNGSTPRTLLFNVRVPLVAKNVDSVLLRCTANQALDKKNPYVRNPHFYLALGELKGGIDPAGADEHWKTANHTLGRIGNSFAGAGVNAKRYFVGAAIANAMAGEMFSQLQSGQLSNAANLTSDNQLSSFCDWLVAI